MSRCAAGRRWATDEEWDLYRDEISCLYSQTTLKNTMETMKTRHDFFGTVRMYKARIKAWELRKNMNFYQVKKKLEYLIAHDGVPLDEEHYRHLVGLLQYIRRLPHDKQQVLIKLYSQLQSVLVLRGGLTQADDLHHMEECLHGLKSWVLGLFDKKVLTRDTIPATRTMQIYIKWYHTAIVASAALRFGRTTQAFRLIQPYFEQYRDMLLARDPRLFPATIAFAALIYPTAPQLGVASISYAADISSTVYGKAHPYSAALRALAGITPAERQPIFMTLIGSIYQILQDQLKPGDQYRIYVNQDHRATQAFALRNDLALRPVNQSSYQVSRIIAKFADFVHIRSLCHESGLEAIDTTELMLKEALSARGIVSPSRAGDSSDSRDMVELQRQLWNHHIDAAQPTRDGLVELSLLADLELFMKLNNQAKSGDQVREVFMDLLDNHVEHLTS